MAVTFYFTNWQPRVALAAATPVTPPTNDRSQFVHPGISMKHYGLTRSTSLLPAYGTSLPMSDHAPWDPFVDSTGYSVPGPVVPCGRNPNPGSPYYNTFSDNSGNTMTFVNDGTLNGRPYNLKGCYTPGIKFSFPLTGTSTFNGSSPTFSLVGRMTADYGAWDVKASCAMGYIWRPSNSTIVGYVFKPYYTHWDIMPPLSIWYASPPGSFPTAWATFVGGPPLYSYFTYTVSGVQDGDVFVIEVWLYYSRVADSVSNPSYLDAAVEFLSSGNDTGHGADKTKWTTYVSFPSATVNGSDAIPSNKPSCSVGF